jgi:hypothetical protein
MKIEDAPNVFLALEEKVTHEKSEEDEIQESGLKEVLNPTRYEKLDVL